MIDESDPHATRWHLRFTNFRAALATLREGAEAYRAGNLPQLARDGLIQRFEYTWEAGWKAMRDYLLDSGVRIAVINPANVIRAAFQAGLISNGDAWLQARKDRTIVSHEYGLNEAERIASDIVSTYLALLDELEERLDHERQARD